MAKVAVSVELIRQELVAGLSTKLDTLIQRVEDTNTKLDTLATAMGSVATSVSALDAIAIRLGYKVGEKTLFELIAQIRDGIGTLEDGIPGQSLRQITAGAARPVDVFAMGIVADHMRVHRAVGLVFADDAIARSVSFNGPGDVQAGYVVAWEALPYDPTRYGLYGSNRQVGVQLSTAYPDNAEYTVKLTPKTFAGQAASGVTAFEFTTSGGNGAGNLLLTQGVVWEWEIKRTLDTGFGPELTPSGEAFPSLYLAYQAYRQ